MKRFFTALLTAALLLGGAASFSSCGSSLPAKQRVDHVYRVSTVQLDENFRIRRLFSAGGKQYVNVIVSYPDVDETEELIYEISADERRLKPSGFTIYTPENAGNNRFSMNAAYCENGNSWNFFNSRTRDEKTRQWIENNTVVVADRDGNVVFEKELKEITGEEANYVQRTASAGNSLICTDSNAILYKISENGELENKIKLRETEDNFFDVSSINVVGDTVELILQEYTENHTNITFAVVDLKTGKTEKTAMDYEEFRGVNRCFLGEGYSFYYTTDQAVFGYDVESGTSTMLMDLLNSDCSVNMLNDVYVLSSERFVAYGYDEAVQGNVISVMEHVPDDQVQEKYLITLAVLGDGYQARRNVIRFNRTSDEYRVIIKAYNPDKYIPSDGSEYVYSDLIKRVVDEMNNEIVGGKVPDLLLVSEYIPLDNYAAKGLLVDLYDYMDADEEIDRGDYLENILHAQEIDGKLYRIMPYFRIVTYAAKTENLNGMTSWTMDDFIKWKDALPEDVQVFRNMPRDELLRYFISYAHDDFIDQATGKCSFDAPDFRHLLEYVASVGELNFWEQQELNNDGLGGNNSWQEYESMMRDGKAMLDSVTLSNFNSFRTIASNTFASEDVTFIGLPVAKGNGGSLTCDETYAMFKKSKLKDGAWEFIRYYLSKDYQDALNNQFPLREESLDILAQNAIESDEQRRIRLEQQQQNNPGRNNNNRVNVFITREKADEIIAYIKSISRTSSTNLTVINIIREEAGPYFAGQKSLDDTVRIIQNRVSTVIAEAR